MVIDYIRVQFYGVVFESGLWKKTGCTFNLGNISRVSQMEYL